MPGTLSVTSLDEGRWPSLREQWNELLPRSAADPLFMSWDWLNLWWTHFRAGPEESLVCLVVQEGVNVVGFAPMVISAVRRRAGLRLRSAQCAGFRLNETRGMLSEYQDVVASRGREADVRAAVLDALVSRHGCQEVVFGWSKTAADWAPATKGNRIRRLRLVSPQTSYQADLSQGFTEYLATLGGSTRRSVFNLRRRLEELGPVEYRALPPSELPAGIDELNRLHALRWGSPVFTGRTLAFNKALADVWKDSGRIVISQLHAGGRCISALYDIRSGTRQYNLQMGFDPQVSTRISPGLLHLGYAMERAAQEGVLEYDFLGGGCMSNDYKRHLASTRKELHTAQILDGFWPVTLSTATDAARHLVTRTRAERIRRK